MGRLFGTDGVRGLANDDLWPATRASRRARSTVSRRPVRPRSTRSA